jgi:mono/diheme cytochrome c family protein
MEKKLLLTLTLLIATILSACGSQTAQTPTEPATATQAATQPTQPPAATEIPATIATDLPTDVAAAIVSSEVSFANEVMPIFEANCIKCHGGEKTKEGLDLKTFESLMAGSFNGSVIEAGNANDSLIIQQIVEGEMPKRGDKLSESDIQILINWVNAGALNN